MILPTGKRRLQINQGGLKHKEIIDSDIFEKVALSSLPGQVFDNDFSTPQDKSVSDAMSQGGLDPARHDSLNPDRNSGRDLDDLGIAGGNANAVAPAGHQPIKAQPTGVVPDEDVDVSQEPTFWEQLAQAISPFMKQRHLQLLGSPKISDNKNNVYELLMGPKLDPRTQQPMQLPDAAPDQLYADANEIARAAGGRIFGIPFIDSKSVWHIPLQLGGDENQAQQKVEKGGPPLGAPTGKGQVTQSV